MSDEDADCSTMKKCEVKGVKQKNEDRNKEKSQARKESRKQDRKGHKLQTAGGNSFRRAH